MRIFYAFLIIVIAAVLFMLPLTEASYDFRTDERTDSFDVDTGVGESTDNVTLHAEVYDDDLETISILSDLSTDSPVADSYGSATREVAVSGLTENTTRELDVTYDIDALDASDAISGLIDRLPWVWLLTIIAFPMAALFAIFTGRT